MAGMEYLEDFMLTYPTRVIIASDKKGNFTIEVIDIGGEKLWIDELPNGTSTLDAFIEASLDSVDVRRVWREE